MPGPPGAWMSRWVAAWRRRSGRTPYKADLEEGVGEQGVQYGSHTRDAAHTAGGEGVERADVCDLAGLSPDSCRA